MDQVYIDKYHCTGCRACEDRCPTNAIQMEQDDEGFLYPVIYAHRCINCIACVKICPQRNILNFDSHNVSKSYGLKHKDNTVLENSTSGGAFTAIVETLYSMHPDLVVYGAVLEKREGSFIAVHKRASNIKEINQFRGSKYIQSDLERVYQQIHADLTSGLHVLFTGTPCQIAGVYRRFQKYSELKQLLLVDIICHAVPSPLMFN